ncbi:MAG: hypothetical protein ACKOEL_01005 [Planctomycetota bacterium]
MSTLRSTCVAVALATAPAASAQHVGDIGLRIASGTIETTEITGGGYGAPRRVFTGTFGDTGVAWFTANPGYDAAPGTFAAGTRAGVRFAEAVLAWDGSAFVPTSPSGALAGERLRLSFLTASATSAAGPAAGIDLAVQADGGWHRHFNMTLLPAPGAAAPDVGVYLVALEAYSTAAGVSASARYWLVLNGGDTPERWADAVAAAEAMANPPTCPADLDGDGTVGGADLGLLLGAWGTAGPGDLDGSGTVTGSDLGLLLGGWGACP